MKRLSLTALAVLLAAACCKTADIQLFSATSPSIALGDSTELVIKTDPDLHLYIDQGIGDVTGKTLVPIAPTSTTTYTLTAYAWYGRSTATTTVSVGHGAASQDTLAGLSSE